MKTIGLLGGMSWESTASYYRIINELTKQRLGGFNSAKIIMLSINFAEIETLQAQERWDEAAAILIKDAQSIERGGAKVLLICTNTMHKIANQIEQAISIPLLHIADATGAVLQKQQIKKIGLLGTRFTMEESFYKDRLQERFGIATVIPSIEERHFIHETIFQELCLGKIKETSRERFVKIIESCHQQGAEGVILGCTEIAMLVNQEHTAISLFDTTTIHAEKAVEFMLSK